MADRVGVINKGELVVVDEKASLMRKLGKKQLTLHLAEPMAAVPTELAQWDPSLANDGTDLIYAFDGNADQTGIPSLLRRMSDLGIGFRDLRTRESSLEDIFVDLVSDRNKP
jgi:ABC-2 type transport system ATP-binding protein